MGDEDGTVRAAEGRFAERHVEPWAWISCLTTQRGRGRAHAPAEAAGDLRTVCVKREQGWESGVTECHRLQWTMALDIDRRLFLELISKPCVE
jgi:hypothetical protein